MLRPYRLILPFVGLVLMFGGCSSSSADSVPTQAALVAQQPTTVPPTDIPPTTEAPTTETLATEVPTSQPTIPATVAPTDEPAKPTTAPVTEGLNEKIDVGGYSLHIDCSGSGSPTVILDTGLGVDSSVWSPVITDVMTFTRVCRYDRAGLGQSDAAPKPRTTKDMVNDLHTLLTKANIAGPYVLAGWSIGGFTTRLYASEYRQDVVGMVLIDSSHPDQSDLWLDMMPAATRDESSDLTNLRKVLKTIINNPDNNPEGMDIPASSDQVRATGSLGDMPLVVLTRGISDWAPGLPKGLSAKLEWVWFDLQKQQATLSTNSTHMIANQSHHCIPCGEPNLVVDAIRKVVDQAHTK